MVQEEDKQNQQLLDLSKQILSLTSEAHSMADSFADREEITALTKEVRSLSGSLADRKSGH